MTIPPKVIVHTDILVDHLLHRGPGPSAMRLAMQRTFCYTTVFNAVELFSLTKTVKERLAVEDALSSLKILGLNSRSAKRFGAFMADGVRLDRFNLFVAGMAQESKLPILTGQPEEFKGFTGIKVIPPGMLAGGQKELHKARLRTIS